MRYSIMLKSYDNISLLYLMLSTLYFHPKNSVVSLSVPVEERCLSGWLRYQNHCIKFFVERKTWVKAREACQAFEGDLVTIGDANKQSFVYGNLAVGRTLWIGLRRDDNDVFHWVDGTEVQFLNWVTGAPDSLSEKCGEMTDYGSFRGKWNDKHCSSTQPFVCEIAMTLRNVFKISPEKILVGHVINRFRATSDVECLLRCQRYPGCKSINFIRSTSESKGHDVCELNGHVHGILSGILHTEEQSSYYDTI